MIKTILFIALFTFTIVAQAEDVELDVVNGKSVSILDWEALMPEGFNYDELLGGFDKIDNLDDFDPKAQQMLADMQMSLKLAPVRSDLDGKMVKLPGFVVPLEGDGQQIFTFFLVPYFGACIHVPPPPANQLVYVDYQPGTHVDNLYDAVWVTGILKATLTENELGAAGYSMTAFRIEPYELVDDVEYQSYDPGELAEPLPPQ